MNKLSTITVTGPDAFEFLQGQLTNDLHHLGAENEILAAWCNPKGRVIWFGTVWLIEQGYGLSVPAETASDIVKRLAMFRFRSKVEFEIVDEGATVDPAFLIQYGYAFIGPEQVEQFTPHMLNLDLLDAISLDKGCYTGQEIVARTHYRGATKRRLHRFTADGDVSAGDKVMLDDRAVGDVVNVIGRDLLAVVPTDKSGEPLNAGGASLTLVPSKSQD